MSFTKITNPDEKSIFLTNEIPVREKLNRGKILTSSSQYPDALLSISSPTWTDCVVSAGTAENLVESFRTNPNFSATVNDYLFENNSNTYNYEYMYYTYDSLNKQCYLYPVEAIGTTCSLNNNGNCQITSEIAKLDNIPSNNLKNSYLVSGKVTKQNGYEFSLCALPLSNASGGDCAVSIKTAIKHNSCTGFTKVGSFGNFCRTYFNEEVEKKGDLEVDNLVQLTCDAHNNIPECSCVKREQNERFQEFKNSAFGAVSDVCWWSDCKIEGFDRLIKPSMLKARNGCSGNFCGNFLTILDSQDIQIFDEFRQDVSCNDEEWETAERNVSIDLSEVDEKTETSVKNIVIYIIAGIIILALVLFLLYTIFIKK